MASDEEGRKLRRVLLLASPPTLDPLSFSSVIDIESALLLNG